MSPPKVSLAGKDVPKPKLDEDDTEEKCGGPAIVSVQVERFARINRHDYNRRKARRVMCGVTMIIIIALAALGTMALAHRLRRHHHNRKHWSLCYGSKRLGENVNVDHKNKLIHVKHDPDNEAKTPPMEILHEYNRGMVAYKDMNKKICYIDRLDETFETGYERWEAYERHDRKDQKTLKVISKPIEVVVMQHILDVHITLHCKDSKSVWVMEIDEKEVTTVMETIRV